MDTVILLGCFLKTIFQLLGKKILENVLYVNIIYYKINLKKIEKKNLILFFIKIDEVGSQNFH